MNEDEFDLPSPEALAIEAAEMEPKVYLREYYGALRAMRDKHYSYSEIAEWISERLGFEITRNKVAYLLNTPPEVLEAEDEEEQMERRADELEGGR